MARRSRYQPLVEGGIDFTPIIDIVFNLLIFFMLVSELNNSDLVQLRLPFADQAEEPELASKERPPERALQLNITADGDVLVRGSTYRADLAPGAEAPRPGVRPLADLLAREADAAPREPRPAGQAGPAPSSLRVHIRADRHARFEHVQAVLAACVRDGIHRTSLVANTEEPRR